MADELDTAIATMTPEQMQELNVCLQQLAKKLIPRLPKDFRKEFKQGLDEIRTDSRLGDSHLELRRKALALDILTRIVFRTGLWPDDPLTPIFVRSMDALSQIGLVKRWKVDMESEEGEAVRQRFALQNAAPASKSLN